MTACPVEQIAALLQERNEIDRRIAALISRPMTAGHLGEWIASEVFDIELEESAAAAAIDGRFRSGPLPGRTVNVKWYLKRESLLDLTDSPLLDHYLVLAGPRAVAASSRSQLRPWTIESVYLFDAQDLLAVQRERGVKVGIASSVRAAIWEAAEIYPRATNPRYPVSDHQAELLRAFAPS